ncbi:AfsR/SARP family transcriptional regulator [Kutzneria sp. CA-103260]|uniref:AfsR/SARP family transcriptional regulator n=1 Tax=Kutzneria sp. CA-103260 TaxID=2802641 RepID=UPI001BABAEE8|nr:BTAD domain-containing putative transcriptional regulator [Kutzneria sp. CA-103260]QUQ72259.1 Regulatory protein AfsR [Kutzneria sp. CA-103260]
MAVELRLLGAVEATANGRTLDLGPARQRCVLVALAVGAGNPTSLDQLADRVWAERLPSGGRKVLYGYLSRLRRIFEDVGVTIERRSGGYVLTVDDGAVDLHRFRTLVAGARCAESDEESLALYDQALGLWYGEAVADLDTPWFVALRGELATERLAVQLDHAEVALRCGRHAELLPALSTLAMGHPLDERLAGLLMLALHQSGRQADALERYELTRKRLADELGIDPGRQLREAHLVVLAAEPAGAPVTTNAVPRQLPAPPRWFIGRTGELAQLDQAIVAGSTVVISTIGGMGGIGKTYLALQWAYRNLHRYPDGQLFVNLGGFDGTGEPVSTAAAVRRFLDALGVVAGAIPADVDSQLGMYRGLVADRRMLIVLDNARDTAQVAPLLPGGTSCTVLVTSRHRLGGLVAAHGAQPLALGGFDPGDARALLTCRLGQDKVAAEPAAVDELVRHCAGLPLALGIVAARAASHPDFGLAAVADEMAPASARLDALDVGELTANLRAAFTASYNALSDGVALMFCQLGLVPGPDISVSAAASLFGLPGTAAASGLRELEAAHLVQQHLPGRYRMHDLITLYAAEQARRHLDQVQRTQASQRLSDFYIHTAYAGERLLDPDRPAIELPAPPPSCTPERHRDVTEALAWLETEHPAALAMLATLARAGDHARTWRLAWSLGTFQWRRGHVADNLETWRVALAAARALGDLSMLSQAHRRLGLAFARANEHEPAVEQLRQAVDVAERAGDPADLSVNHQSFAWVCARQGRDAEALLHAERALRLLPQAAVDANSLNLVGWYKARSGQFEQALEYCEAALTACRREGNREVEADTLDSLGFIAHNLGRHNEAVAHYRQAATLFSQLGHVYELANTFDILGRSLCSLGQGAEADAIWRRALALFEAQHRTSDATRIRRQLRGFERRTAVASARTPIEGLAKLH